MISNIITISTYTPSSSDPSYNIVYIVNILCSIILLCLIWHQRGLIKRIKEYIYISKIAVPFLKHLEKEHNAKFPIIIDMASKTVNTFSINGLIIKENDKFCIFFPILHL